MNYCIKKSLIVNFSFLILSAYPINILDRAYFLKQISESVDMDKAQVLFPWMSSIAPYQLSLYLYRHHQCALQI